MQATLNATMDMIRTIKRASNIKVNRNFEGFFADRLVQAVAEASLLAAIERLSKTVDAQIEYLGGSRVAAFLAAAQSDKAASVLAWLRRYPRVAAMLAMLKDEDYAAALPGITIEETADTAGDAVDAKPCYDIGITVRTLAPLAHGADIKAGNATLFRRRQALTPSGNVLELPYYSGNALRGQMRDLLADDLLTHLGLGTDRSKPVLNLWFFHALYAGGVLDEQGGKITAKLDAAVGKNGALRTDGIRHLRNMLPSLSLLGAALGNRIICGRISVGDLRPACREWGTGDTPVHQLLEHVFLTRRDDYEGRGEADKHAGMIATTETIKQGAVLHGGIDLDTHATEIERSCLGRGLRLLAERGMLGADNRRGLGKVAFEWSNLPEEAPYLQFLTEHKDDIIGYLGAIDALASDTEGVA